MKKNYIGNDRRTGTIDPLAVICIMIIVLVLKTISTMMKTVKTNNLALNFAKPDFFEKKKI